MSTHGHEVVPIGVEEFVRLLDANEIAAVELLGELPSEDIKGGPRIRIPNNFPITENDRRDEFFLRAQGVGLLYPVGTNRNGVMNQVWELRADMYERILQVMTTLGCSSAGRVSFAGDAATEEEAVPSGTDGAASLPEAAAPEPVLTVPQLRELFSEAKARRAAAQAESQELGMQYRAMIAEIGETAKSLADLQKRIADLHQHRLSLKRRLKTANVAYNDACIETKQRAKALAEVEKATLDSLSTDAADLLRGEAARQGISLEQMLALIRKKLTVPSPDDKQRP